IALNYANFNRWQDVSRFFAFTEIAQIFGYSRQDVWSMTGHWPGRIFILAFGLTISSLIVTFAIRYDNFGSAFKTAMKISAPLFVLTCIGAWLQRGWGAFEHFDPLEFTLGVLGYLFWGCTQQLLFSSYFCTRLRKAYAPDGRPGNSVAPERRIQVTLLSG